MRRLFKFKYPKILALIIIILLSYIIFSNQSVQEKFSGIGKLSYLGIFIGGLLFAFGFTAPLAIGLFIILSPSNIILATVVGALGALLTDMIIFKTIKLSFMDEFSRLEKTKTMKEAIAFYHKDVNKKLQTYLLYAFAGICIASPLPDEVGVSMLAGLSHIKATKLAIIGLACHLIGIFLILHI